MAWPRLPVTRLPEESARIVRLMQAAAAHLALDLEGLTVLTEAGTNAYAVTPVLAALAGSTTVYALTSDSSFGSSEEACRQVEELSEAAGLDEGRIRFVTDRGCIPPGIDVVTNLGFVRPIDREILGKLSAFGVVSCMHESWEVRSEDVDLQACRELGIAVAGVCEDFDGMDVFQSCGQLAVKICLEAGLEVAGNKIVVMSSDRFGPVIVAALRANLADVRLLATAGELEKAGSGNDAVVVADYLAEQPAIDGGEEALEEFAAANPASTFVQFAGALPLDRLRALGLRVHPGKPLEPRRMMFTLAHLGPRPVVYLHAAGLKVGELLWRRGAQQKPLGPYASLVQELWMA